MVYLTHQQNNVCNQNLPLLILIWFQFEKLLQIKLLTFLFIVNLSLQIVHLCEGVQGVLVC